MTARAAQIRPVLQQYGVRSATTYMELGQQPPTVLPGTPIGPQKFKQRLAMNQPDGGASHRRQLRCRFTLRRDAAHQSAMLGFPLAPSAWIFKHAAGNLLRKTGAAAGYVSEPQPGRLHEPSKRDRLFFLFQEFS